MFRHSETPTNPTLWEECKTQAIAAHPGASADYIEELTAKSYEYQFLERLCNGEPYEVVDNTTKEIDAFFAAKFGNGQG